MRKLALAAFVALALGCRGVPVAQYTCYKSLGDITIDGELNERSWAKAPGMGEFMLYDGVTASPSRTTAKMVWDDDFLYVAFWCDDRDIYATYEDNDAPLYTQDVCEVFISEMDYGMGLFVEYEVSPLSKTFDMYLMAPYQGLIDWDSPKLRAATKFKGALNDPADPDGGYTVEMAIPIADVALRRKTMGGVRDGVPLRMNLYRIDYDTPERIGGPGAGQTLIAWSPTLVKRFHRPERFGVVLLVDTSVEDMPVP